MVSYLSGLLILVSLSVVAPGHDYHPYKQYPPPHYNHHHHEQHQYSNQPQNQNTNQQHHQNHQTHQTSSAQSVEQQWPFIKSNFSQYNVQVQSPTNINTSCVTRAVLTPVTIHLRDVVGECVSIENTGYYLEMRLVPGTRMIPYVTGGPLLQDRYVFEQMHFHWGHNDRCGSEHWVDGKCFSMEVHVVMYNEKYGSNSEATRHPDGLTVISFFGEVSPRDNPSFNSLISKMASITEPETNTTGSFQKEFLFLSVLFQANTYFTFPGSLTTPPYSECVTWVVYPEKPFPISARQISAFRKLRNSEGRIMVRGNDRPLQPFGNRPMRQPLINGEPEIVNRFNGNGGRM